MILVDTSVWIDFLRGESSVHRRVLHELIENEEDLCVTCIIITEILRGVKEENDYRRVKDYILRFPVYDPRGVETYIRAAEIYRKCRKNGKTIRKTVDCVIASIAIEFDLVIFHKDSDFISIKECFPLKALNVSEKEND